MNLLPRAEIWCPLSVLERVCIIEGFFQRNVWEFCQYIGDRLSVIERCPYKRGVRTERFDCSLLWFKCLVAVLPTDLQSS